MTGYLSKPPPGVQVNRNHQLAQGLVGCWIFNEGSGLRSNDLSGNNNDGLLTNFEPFSPTSGWTGGNFGTALAFNGINNSVQNTNTSVLNLTVTPSRQTSIMIWFYPLTDINWVVSKQAGPGDGWRVVVDTVLKLFWEDNGGGTEFIFSSNSVILNKWNFACYTLTDTNFNVNLNGIITTTSFASVTFHTSTGIIIGANYFGNFFNGRISDVRVWNRALSINETQQLYDQPYGMFKFK